MDALIVINSTGMYRKAVLLASVILSGCGIDREPLSLYGDTGSLLSQIRFEHRAYNLAIGAPYDTATLNVSGLTMKGNKINAPIRYEVAPINLLDIDVDSTGFIKAKRPVAAALVKAISTTEDGVSMRDSVYINVAPTVPLSLPKKVKFELMPGDSAKLGYSSATGRGVRVNVVKADENGNSMPALLVGIWSSDQSKGTIALSGAVATVNWRLPGSITFYISTYAYGKKFLDSLPFLMGYPVSAFIGLYGIIPSGSKEAILDFHPKRMTVGLGACVHWGAAGLNDVGADLLAIIEFDDPSSVSAPKGSKCLNEQNVTIDEYGGNIPGFKAEYEESIAPDGKLRVTYVYGSSVRARVFNKPGTYKYRHPVYQTEGEIYVCDEKNDKTCSPDNFKWEDGR